MDLAVIANLAAQPVSTERPAGADMQYEDDYLALVAELDNAEGIDIQPVDWSVVHSLALKILQEQSKDLRVAGYLSVALHHQQGFAGLAVGLRLLTGLLTADYWDDLYPQRPKRQNKARAAAFDWVIKKLERPLDEVEIQHADLAAVIEAAGAFDDLDDALNQRLETDAPANLYELRNRLNRFRQEAKHLQREAQEKAQKEAQNAAVPPAKPASEPRPKAPVSTAAPAPVPAQPQPASAPSVPAAEVQTVASAADVDRVLTANSKSVEKLCELLRQQQPTDPRAYYLLRTSKWMILDKLPPSGVIPPIPNEERMKQLVALEQTKEYAALVQEIEKSFAAGAIFHLGLHRMAANALQALGAPEASKMVKICVAQLLERFPEFSQRTFANQDGFVDELTQAWIDTEVRVPQAGDAGGDAETDADATPWLAAAREAKKLAAGGQFEAGVALFRQGIHGAVNEREHCFWHLEQARFCFEAGHLEIALPQLTHLYDEMQRRQLQRWEPQLNLAIIKLLLACHAKKQAKQKYAPEQQKHVDALRTQLCLMDPLGALSL